MSGAHCVVIGAPLIVKRCPIKSRYQCTWAHRTTGVCKYNPEYKERLPTPNELARLVGLERITKEQAENIRNQIRDTYLVEIGSKHSK